MELRPGWNVLGLSREGRAIEVYSTRSADSAAGDWTLLVGGTHGDERATVAFLQAFIARLTGAQAPVAVLPLLNPDGFERDSRYNARGVDLNRNFPEHWSEKSEEPPGEAPLSEPETRLLHDLIEALRPARIVSLHWALSEIDPDGAHSLALARGMWETLGEEGRRRFRLREPGPPLPGSLGSLCRREGEGNPAMVTLELPYHPEPEWDPLPPDHLDTVRALWAGNRDRYWEAVYPAVEAMLRFAARL